MLCLKNRPQVKDSSKPWSTGAAATDQERQAVGTECPSIAVNLGEPGGKKSCEKKGVLAERPTNPSNGDSNGRGRNFEPVLQMQAASAGAIWVSLAG